MATEEELNARAAIEVVDPHNVQRVFVDYIVTGGMNENIVNVTLGAVDFSLRKVPTDPPQVVITSRLSMNRETALRLYQGLANVLGLPPPEGSETPQAPQPPKNMMN